MKQNDNSGRNSADHVWRKKICMNYLENTKPVVKYRGEGTII